MALQLSRRASQGASNIILGIGVTVIGISASVFAIDMPYYFNVRNQLQTAVDAAALAGAAQLPVSEASAEQAAITMAGENPVAGQVLDASNLKFTANKARFSVSASTKVPTIVGKFLCALTGGKNGGHSINDDDGSGSSDSGGGGFSDNSASCDDMTVVAGSAAEPAARDTVLVIDTSSSMDDLGNGRPMKDIKTAANNFITTIAGLDNNYVDQIGLVSFNQTGTLQIGLTSQKTSSGFQSVKDKISTKLNLFSGTGWNTNYEAGLKTAVDELANHGRKNAQQIIIFMTDGMPNLPAPDSYYSYSQYEPYRKCTDPVNNSTTVKAKCTRQGNQTVCPVLPSSTITDSMINSSAVSCGQSYVNAMASKTNTQTDRANTLGINIYTISIYYPGADDNAQEVLRRLIKQPSWRPGQLDYMAKTTGGTGYEAAAYDATRINDIYKTIAQDIHIKLVN
jgi:hypothetical protein